jgi:pimeloyl-ACP methyl ester carboxylesterase
MNNTRRYGKAPFDVAVIHGGPGAPGEMAPVARELASDGGVLEPFQTSASVDGQVNELKSQLEESADIPVTLIGFSWGAWLGVILAASYPALVKKLILVGSGPFEEKYAAQVQKTKLSRFNKKEKTEYDNIIKSLSEFSLGSENVLLSRLGELCSKTDQYDATVDESEPIGFQANVFRGVWPEAAWLRKSGKLLDLAKDIKCPVIAIHGDYDPHPAEGVQKPLSNVLMDFRFILLTGCGHKPWLERQARDRFYAVLEKELV